MPLTEAKIREIKELMDYRKQFYERADYHVRTSRMTVDRVVSEIQGALKDDTGNK